VEFVTPLSNDEDHVDAYHDTNLYGTASWRTSSAPVLGLVPHALEVELHLAHDDSEPELFAEVEGHVAWHATML
jgi:hypothetical protein